MSVLLAIRISMSLPFIFTPVFYNGCHYVDGALLRNFGIEFCDPQKTIGLTTPQPNTSSHLSPSDNISTSAEGSVNGKYEGLNLISISFPNSV